MDFIDRLKLILEAPEDDIDSGIEPEDEGDIEPEGESDVPETAKSEDGESEKSEVEKLVDKEQGVVDWTGIPDPTPGKSIVDLKSVRKPLENGWTTEEVISALKPTILFFAKKYSTPTFSVEDGIAECMTGVLTALKNDKGLSAFTTHVYRYLSTSAQRGAGKASNVSGVPQTKGGKYDFLAASRATVSADTPMPSEGDKEETYSSQIESHYGKAGESAAKQRSMAKLIKHFLNAPSVGLSDKEKLILQLTYGISEDGKIKEPKSTKELADTLGVSLVRISQIRTGAINKIKEYIDARKFSSEEQAAEKLGLEESKLLAIAKGLLNIIKETIQLEIDILSENQIIKIESNHRGINETVSIIVDTVSLEVKNAISENNESVLGEISKSLLDEATSIAKSRVSKEYFCEMVNNVISMQAQPILATINNSLSVNQIPFRFLRNRGIEKAMGDAEKKVFGKRNIEDAVYESNGDVREITWWYPIKYRSEISKMRDIMGKKGFIMKENVGSKLRSGTYVTEVNVPYLNNEGNTTYRVEFLIYGEFLEETEIIRIDDVDTGDRNIDLVTVDLDTIEKAINEKIKSGEIHKISDDEDNEDNLTVRENIEDLAPVAKESPRYERMFYELSPEEQNVLNNIKTVDDLKSVEVVGEWSDDHVPCVGVKINGVEIGFWWLDNSGIAAFHYPDSGKAKQTIVDIIIDQIKMYNEDPDNNI
jgi:RNA polymerase sigma factor (sigma-70 family)